MFEKNKELAQATLDTIRADLEHWDQDAFGQVTPCGTKFCFAGHAAILSGAKFNSEDQMFYVDGKCIYPEFFAMERLGLDQNEANSIFYCFTRDFDYLQEIVAEVFDLDV